MISLSAHVTELRNSTAPVPRTVLLFHRLDFDWLNPVLMQRMRETHGTRFVLMMNDRSLKALGESWCGPEDEIVYLDEIERAARAAAAQADPAAASAQARTVEAELGITYFRDLIQQHRAVSAYYLQYAPNTAWSIKPDVPFDAVVAEINYYFDYFGRLLDEKRIDLILERPGGLASTACLHLGMAKGIPVSFSLVSRFESYVMWSHGAYLGHDMLRQQFDKLADVPLVPLDSVNPPADSAKNIAKSAEFRSTKTLLRNIALSTLNHAIWTYQDIKRRRKGRRLPWNRVVRNQISTYLTYRYLERTGIRNMDELCSRPFVLFLLQLEPEFTTTSLAREFNNTAAVLQQLALSLPAGYRLVVKEHVTSIGNRDLGFYKKLLHLPNVVMADYRIRGLDLAAKAAAVSTISDTVAMEAALLGKNAVIFAEHVEFGFMPHVHLCTSMRDLPAILKKAVAPMAAEQVTAVRQAGAKYRESLRAISFHAPGTRAFRGTEASFSEAEQHAAVDRLLDTFRQQLVAPAV